MKIANRCLHKGCKRAPTTAFRIQTPSAGYPIKVGSILAPWYLTGVACQQHVDDFSLGDFMPDAGRAIAAAMLFRGAPPDLDRSYLERVALDDPEWLEFVGYVERQRKAG